MTLTGHGHCSQQVLHATQTVILLPTSKQLLVWVFIGNRHLIHVYGSKVTGVLAGIWVYRGTMVHVVGGTHHAMKGASISARCLKQYSCTVQYGTYTLACTKCLYLQSHLVTGIIGV